MAVSVTAHEKRLRALPCAVSRRSPVTLHHCHGGSVLDLGFTKGVALKTSPFLQIPLHADFHVGRYGVDAGVGVRTWERRFGTQVEYLGWVSAQLGYDVIVLAREWEAS